jgi:competence protein ComEA
MSARKTLWEFLESSASPRVLDTHDEGLDDDYFSPGNRARAPRWNIALGAGLGLVAVVVLVAVGAHMFRQSTPVAEVLPEIPLTTVDVSGEGAVVTTETVIVHIAGAVVTPGVIELPANSRIIDALAKAGGPRPDAVIDQVNLARILFDGEHIVIPAVGDELLSPEASGVAQPVSLSRATQAQLEELPRIGPATAQRIIAWREAHGPFRSVDDVLAVSGIGPATLEGIRALVVP